MLDLIAIISTILLIIGIYIIIFTIFKSKTMCVVVFVIGLIPGIAAIIIVYS